jgi:hypothetical protein
MVFFLISACCLPLKADGSELLLPLPGQKQINNVEKKQEQLEKKKQQKKERQQRKKKGSELLIPLPAQINKPVTQEQPTENPPANEKSEDNESSPLIMIRPMPEEETDENINDEDQFPEIPDEIVIEPDNIAPLEELPSASNGNQDYTSNQSDINSNDEKELPIFPKDTSSAVFMVMKTWKADDYDGNTLLAHAVEVYSKEAGESFQIKGLSDKNSFNIDVDEEDITLDELLDLISLKTGRDWGVDIPSGTIYFYPEGVDTGTYSYW